MQYLPKDKYEFVPHSGRREDSLLDANNIETYLVKEINKVMMQIFIDSSVIHLKLNSPYIYISYFL